MKSVYYELWTRIESPTWHVILMHYGNNVFERGKTPEVLPISVIKMTIVNSIGV
jgi:hypothetical protein